VIGAGIGGLAAAVALGQRGWQVELFERSPEIAPVGAGIAVAPNGLRALDVVGLGGAVRERAVRQGAGGYRRPDGRWLMRQDLGVVATALGDPFVVLRRADLVALLVEQLPGSTLHLGTEVLTVDPGDRARRARVTTERGEVEADLVVASDGLRSRVRTLLFPDHPGTRYAGYVAWRLLPTVVPRATQGGLFETWGRGRRFSALPMAGGEVYCWATVTGPPDQDVGDDRAHLLAAFAGWHDPIPELIHASPPDRILRHDVVELAAPVPALHAGRIALVGDAGHAMTPDLGQGGCLALEDAVTLAVLVDAHASPDAALAHYTSTRLPRVTRVATRSRQLARVGQASGPITTTLRQAAMRASGALPATVMARGIEPVVGWRPDTIR